MRLPRSDAASRRSEACAAKQDSRRCEPTAAAPALNRVPSDGISAERWEAAWFFIQQLQRSAGMECCFLSFLKAWRGCPGAFDLLADALALGGKCCCATSRDAAIRDLLADALASGGERGA